ncbi:Stk1 family PASTA domain-containing Ser/Thr kinase [Candidatus Chloroploca sp. Khr17]|uniref:Stk1 family PASTA domain-containing Ser/Thr kinase n=1 Tax=Candidatus Chloroploca sp. Khr17 TaxID=2496869 RepID=UPI00101E0542|nr:Stk1 family PASTA domain-containing Ser/Thr kinase [Candidatus Chloroploca sp. Khr17]
MHTQVLDGRYELEQKIGEGGMARIYLGLDRRLNRRVAIKIPHRHFLSEKDFLERFRHEAQAAAMLAHPNIVDIYDVGQDGDVHYIVMEYVDGTDLKTLILREGPLPVARAIDLATQIARGLQAAHRAGMIHRDIKPQNVIVTHDGQAHVTDFGVAKSHLSTALTETGISFGTVDYLSPEQAQGRPATAQSDIYALGIVLYEMVTARLPFTGDNAVAVAMKHVSEAPVPPRRLNPAIPPGLEALILRALAKDPAQRPRDAQEFINLLSNYSQLAQQATTMNPSLAQTTIATPPVRPSSGTSSSGRFPVPPAPRSTPARAPRQEGPGCGVFLVGMLVLGVLVGMIYLFNSGMFNGFIGSLWGAGGNRPTPTVPSAVTPTSAPDAPTPTVSLDVGIPNLIGLSVEAAETSLRQLQLEPVRREAFDATVAAGQVMSQEIAPGTLVLPGERVTFTVSLGPQLVEVPDLIRTPAAIARSRLTGVGLGVEVVETPSTTIDAGFVIGQTPGPGLRIPQGQVVVLTVSQGDVVRFPNVIGLQRDQAEQILADTPGITLIYVDEQGRDRLIDYDRFRDNEVVSAQIADGPPVRNGDMVPRGSQVILGVKAPGG